MALGNGLEKTTEPAQPKSRQFPCWIDAFYKYTDGTPSPDLFRRWAAVSAVAGALERRTWLHTAANGVLYPNMFLVLIAPPGVGKDQALVPMRDLWSATGLFNLAPISMTHKGLVDQLADASTNKQVLHDGKWYNYHSLLLAVPELGVLMPEHNLGFMSTLNELFNCWDLYEERIRMKGEVLRIERPHLHLIAGTQPKYLGAFLPEAAYGMGFTARIIMIYAGEPVKVSLFTPRKVALDLKDRLVRDLKIIGNLFGAFDIEKDLIHEIERWHFSEGEASKPQHSKLIHYNTRRTMHLLKLAMVFSASRSNEMVIRTEDWRRGKNLLLETEILMPEIFKEIATGGQLSEIEEAFHFAYRFYMREKQAVPEHKLTHFLSSRVPVYQIKWIIDTMLRANMLRLAKYPDGLNIPERERLFEPLALNKVE